MRCTVVGKSKWYHQVFQGGFHLKRKVVSLNLTWVDLAFSYTKSYPGEFKRHSLPFQVAVALKYEIPGGITYFCPRLCIRNSTYLGLRQTIRTL